MSIIIENTVANNYLNALFDTDRARALTIIDEALDKGMTPEKVIFDVVIPGMEQMIGGMISDNLVTLSQHFLASQIAEEVTDRLIPRFSTAPEIQGQVIMGTSHGDFHGLGKKIVIGCLKAKMFKVTDLGINVNPNRFVEEAVAKSAEVIGISSMMIHTATGESGPKRVRQILKERGLERESGLSSGERLTGSIRNFSWRWEPTHGPIRLRKLQRQYQGLYGR